MALKSLFSLIARRVDELINFSMLLVKSIVADSKVPGGSAGAAVVGCRLD